jgi:hypothetical protein
MTTTLMTNPNSVRWSAPATGADAGAGAAGSASQVRPRWAGEEERWGQEELRWVADASSTPSASEQVPRLAQPRRRGRALPSHS